MHSTRESSTVPTPSFTTPDSNEPRSMQCQLQSTRQRLESQAVASFNGNVSPVSREEGGLPVSMEDSAQTSSSSGVASSEQSNTGPAIPKRPKAVACKKKKGSCNHIVVFDKHYNKKAWDAFEVDLNSRHAATEIDPNYVP